MGSNRQMIRHSGQTRRPTADGTVSATWASVLSRSILMIALMSWAGVAHAQSWKDAYQKGDYHRAADLLHEIVTYPGAETSVEPAIFQQLAAMYADGLGVAADSVMACVLAQMAESRAMGIGGERYASETTRAAQIVQKFCGALSAEEREELLTQLGCPSFGLRPQVIDVGGHAVRIDAHGLSFADRSGQLFVTRQCLSQFSTVRVTTVPPPSNALRGVKPRHFVELFVWAPSITEGIEQRVLMWHVAEVHEKGIAIAVWGEPLFARPGLAWPTGLPEGLDSRLSMDMIRSGQVRWRLAGSKPRHGWFLLPDQEVDR